MKKKVDKISFLSSNSF